MRIVRPDGKHTLDVTQKWEIEWEDVVESDPQYARFWLTHSSTEPYRNPVALTDAVNIHKEKRVEIDGKHIENMPTGEGYRVWAMRLNEDPGLQPQPLSESPDLKIENEQNHHE